MSTKSKNGIVITLTKQNVVRSARATATKEECICSISKKARTVKVGSEDKENTKEPRKNIKLKKNKNAQNEFKNPIVNMLSFSARTSNFPIEVETSCKTVPKAENNTPNIFKLIV